MKELLEAIERLENHKAQRPSCIDYDDYAAYDVAVRLWLTDLIALELEDIRLSKAAFEFTIE